MSEKGQACEECEQEFDLSPTTVCDECSEKWEKEIKRQLVGARDDNKSLKRTIDKLRAENKQLKEQVKQ